MKESYIELLKNPKWQRKRLEILQRDNFKCLCCDDGETTLHIHHVRYIKGNKPWEYENEDLITLCEYCHNVWTYIYSGGFGTEYISSITRLHDRLEYEEFNK
jgi:5-methylcytosine-specific restriction endonuclease McrA